MSHHSKERLLMSSTTAVSLERIQSLLERLDPSVDEPCAVAGCVHLNSGGHPLHDVVAGQVAA
jgi:hypothetical protein